MRNKRYDSFTRKLFKEHLNGQNELDLYAEYFTQFMGEMKNMMRYMQSLDNRALDMKRMIENFSKTEKIVDCNLLDRYAKPVADRKCHSRTEDSIAGVIQVENEEENVLKYVFLRIKTRLSKLKSLVIKCCLKRRYC